MRSLWNNIEECYTVIFKKSPIFIISPIYFLLNYWENGKRNYTAESKNQQSFFLNLDLELLIFVKKFEFYLVTQSL